MYQRSAGRSFGGSKPSFSRPGGSSGGYKGRSGGGARPGGASRRPKGQYIHPSKFVAVATPLEETQYTPNHTFEDFAVGNALKKNLAYKKYTHPSPIQDQTIPEALKGRDIIGIANTGTGKTAAFAIPLLHAILEDTSKKALIVAPTRELAKQIQDECRSIGFGLRIRDALLIGGANIGPQFRSLESRPQVVIGTPGRIKDHIERGSLDLSEFSIIVLDEVDRMLDMGFINDMREILSKLNDTRQSYFFSATMDSRVEALIKTFIKNDPFTINVKTGNTADSVHQDIVPYETPAEKMQQLRAILSRQDVEKVIIFNETKRDVERLDRELREHGFKVDAIHGGKNQGQRQRALNKFKENHVTILVATDVAARGIDVPDITHVINYSTPQTYDDYVHRIGRAGRAGKVGYALTFVPSR